MEPTFELFRLRRTRHKLARLALRDTHGDQQLRIALLGDSWTDNRRYWAERLTKRFARTFGRAGIGWFGFAGPTLQQASRSVYDTSVATFAFSSGTWVMSRDSDAPDRSCIRSSVAGDRLTMTTAIDQASARLFWIGGAGVFRCQTADKAWITVEAAAASCSLQTTDLGRLPAGTYAIEVVSGPASLCGILLDDDKPGVRVDKMGVSGSSAASWLTTSEAWEDGIAAHLRPDLMLIMFGTNDQPRGERNFGLSIAALIDRIRSELPKNRTDILLVTPPENALKRHCPMALLSAAARTTASEKQCAHVDLQPYFGDSISEYFDPDHPTCNWLSGRGAHPSLRHQARSDESGDDGGLVIVEALWRAITTSL